MRQTPRSSCSKFRGMTGARTATRFVVVGIDAVSQVPFTVD